MNGFTATEVASTTDYSQNWRVQFFDVDGLPLSMLSFDHIDFGSISYKEIFQNVKTILATPLFSAPLERTLGVDQNIVDLPIGRAAEATVAIIDALYFWENRVEVMNIDFEADVLNGHLRCNLQLRINNVIYGTDQAYDKTTIFAPQEAVVTGPQGPPGPAGKDGKDGVQGARGSYWFVGTVDPGTNDPVTSQPAPAPAPPPIGSPKLMDMYLNTTTGDVWQYQAAAPALNLQGQQTLSWKKVLSRP